VGLWSGQIRWGGVGFWSGQMRWVGWVFGQARLGGLGRSLVRPN